MSWSWKEEHERKSYEVNGTVTISTEEYRDLIEEVQNLLVAGQKEHDDWYKEYQRASALEKEVKALQEKLNEINSWMGADDSPENNLRTAFRQWKLKKQEELMDE